MAFSTSSTIRAWRFEDLDPTLFAELHGCALKEAKRRLAILRKQHADPAWIDAMLARLSVPALAILSLLASHDGAVRVDAVNEVLRDQLGMTRQQLQPALGALLEEALIVGLAHSGNVDALALVAPSADLIAPRVRDLDLTPVVDGPFVPSDQTDGRALLAACCALRHVDVKVTQTGSAHRAGIKRLAKALGLADDKLDLLVLVGQELRLVVPSGDVLRPVPKRLLEAAAGRFATPILEAFCSQLRAHGKPVTFDHVHRWARATAPMFYEHLQPAEELVMLPGFRRGMIGKVAALASAPLDGAASASITPSFEVFLPPESRHEHVVQVLGSAELVRIDRVIVGRITKASIQRAVGAGETGESILKALAAACRTPVPQNVEAAIADWSTGHVHAISATGRVIVVPSSEDARVLAALEMFHPRSLAPGVILLDGEVPARSVSSVLAKLGVHERRIEDEPADDDADDNAAPRSSRQAVPSFGGGDPVLRQRIAAFHAGDPTEVKRAGAIPSRGTGSIAEADDDNEGIDGEGAVSDEAISLIEGWEDEHVRLSDALAMSTAAMLDVIGPFDRKFVLGAKTPAQLDARLHEVLINRGGMQRFLAKHEALIEKVLPQEVVDLVRRDSQGRSSRRVEWVRDQNARNDDEPLLEWHADDLHARLAAAARTASRYLLDLGSQRHAVRVTRLLPRGKVTMVLGEALEDESAVAVPLSSIVRIAQLPSEPPQEAAATAPWRPLGGQTPPPGHLPCPCGSTKKYRACCRATN